MALGGGGGLPAFFQTGGSLPQNHPQAHTAAELTFISGTSRQVTFRLDATKKQPDPQLACPPPPVGTRAKF